MNALKQLIQSVVNKVTETDCTSDKVEELGTQLSQAARAAQTLVSKQEYDLMEVAGILVDAIHLSKIASDYIRPGYEDVMDGGEGAGENYRSQMFVEMAAKNTTMPPMASRREEDYIFSANEVVMELKNAVKNIKSFSENVTTHPCYRG